MNAHQPITATLSDFSRLTGLGRSTIYALLSGGKIHSIKIGKRRLIVVESYRRLIEGQCEAAPENGKPKPTGQHTARPPYNHHVESKPVRSDDAGVDGTTAAAAARRRGRPRKAAASKADNAPALESGVVNTC